MQNYKVGIVGAGTMGKQIALLCASRGIPPCEIIGNGAYSRNALINKENG